MRKYYEEVVLLEQIFVVDGETKVRAVIDMAAKDAGSAIALTAFSQFNLGEGVEKEEGSEGPSPVQVPGEEGTRLWLGDEEEDGPFFVRLSRASAQLMLI